MSELFQREFKNEHPRRQNRGISRTKKERLVSTSLDDATSGVKEFSVSLSPSADASYHKKFSTKTGAMRVVVETALTLPWSPIVWKNNQRLKSEFKSCGIVALDIDGDLSLQDGKAWLKSLGFRSAILLTKSHQKIKASKAACDRFRIIIDAGQVFSLEQYEANMKYWLSLLPMADKACKDGARFFFPSPELAYAQDGLAYVWKDLTGVIAAEKKRQQTIIQSRIAKFSSGGAISEGLRHFILTGVPSGQRHSACFWVACALSDLGITGVAAVRMIGAGAFAELGTEFIERAVRNAGRRSR